MQRSHPARLAPGPAACWHHRASALPPHACRHGQRHRRLPLSSRSQLRGVSMEQQQRGQATLRCQPPGPPSRGVDSSSLRAHQKGPAVNPAAAATAAAAAAVASAAAAVAAAADDGLPSPNPAAAAAAAAGSDDGLPDPTFEERLAAMHRESFRGPPKLDRDEDMVSEPEPSAQTGRAACSSNGRRRALFASQPSCQSARAGVAGGAFQPGSEGWLSRARQAPSGAGRRHPLPGPHLLPLTQPVQALSHAMRGEVAACFQSAWAAYQPPARSKAGKAAPGGKRGGRQGSRPEPAAASQALVCLHDILRIPPGAVACCRCCCRRPRRADLQLCCGCSVAVRLLCVLSCPAAVLLWGCGLQLPCADLFCHCPVLPCSAELGSCWLQCLCCS